MAAKRTGEKKKGRGPAPELLVIPVDWADAVKRAMSKGKPPADVGKPKPRKKKRPQP